MRQLCQHNVVHRIFWIWPQCNNDFVRCDSNFNYLKKILILFALNKKIASFRIDTVYFREPIYQQQFVFIHIDICMQLKHIFKLFLLPKWVALLFCFVRLQKSKIKVKIIHVNKIYYKIHVLQLNRHSISLINSTKKSTKIGLWRTWWVHSLLVHVFEYQYISQIQWTNRDGRILIDV